MLFPIGAGRTARKALEDHAHVLDVLEAGQLSDFLQRKVSLDQKLPDFLCGDICGYQWLFAFRPEQ